MPVLAQSVRKPTKPQPSPKLPVDRIGGSLGKAERITGPRFKDVMWRRLNDLFTRATGLGSGEVTEDQMAADSALGLVGPLAIGVIPAAARTASFQRVMDELPKTFNGRRLQIIQNAIARNPGVTSHIDTISEVMPWEVSNVRPSKRHFQGDWEKMKAYFENAQQIPPEARNAHPVLDMELSMGVPNDDLGRVLGHEMNHVAQVIQKPKLFGRPLAQSPLSRAIPPDSYGYAQYMQPTFVPGIHRQMIVEIPWEARPQELASEVAGWKRAEPSSFARVRLSPSVSKQRPSVGRPYAERLTEAMSRLPESIHDNMRASVGLPIPQQAVAKDPAQNLILGLWERYFNKPGGPKVVDPHSWSYDAASKLFRNK